MADSVPQPFRGFRPEALQFLVDLSLNNERAWFQPRKGDYERLLKEPLEALCGALAERFADRGIPMVADAKRSPFRIYRDTRFSKDKSPYKTNIGADFPWSEGPETTGDEPIHGRPGGYFHLSPTGSFVGGGMWHPEPQRLATWRALVDGDPARVHAAIDDADFVKTHGGVSGDGESLKRVPAGYAADHPDAELLRLKNVVFGRELTEREIGSPRLPDLLCDAFAAAAPVFRLLAAL